MADRLGETNAGDSCREIDGAPAPARAPSLSSVDSQTSMESLAPPRLSKPLSALWEVDGSLREESTVVKERKPVAVEPPIGEESTTGGGGGSPAAGSSKWSKLRG